MPDAVNQPGKGTHEADHGDLAALAREMSALEAAVPALTPGTEALIEWVDGPRRTPLSIVYLHGFSATRQELAPYCAQLGTSLGANVLYARLTGHGQSGRELADARLDDWLEDGRAALAIGERIGERVVLIGTSTGAALATLLAADGAHADALAALVLVSPHFRPRSRIARLLPYPVFRTLLPLLRPSYGWAAVNEEHARYWTTRYPSRALVPVMELVAMLGRRDLSRIETPLLIFYSARDQIVDASAIASAFARFGSAPKRLVPISDTADPRRHVLGGDIMSPKTTAVLTRETLGFLDELST